MMNGNASIVGESELLFSYGRHTPWFNMGIIGSYKDAMPQKPTLGNHWSSTENSSNNSWNVNFNSGNTWNNNKYNSNTVRPSVAHETDAWIKLRKTAVEVNLPANKPKNISLMPMKTLMC